MNDIINEQWMKHLENTITLYENSIATIKDFSNDQLNYLIYWNFGFSGPSLNNDTKAAVNELKRRGVEYDEKRVEKINELSEELIRGLL